MINKGVSFGDVHSYYDLNLILSASEIAPAKPKTIYVEIPGADGSIDLTEANGEVRFEDRDIEFVFTLLPDVSQTYEEKRTEVINLLNGRVFKITLDRDDEYYYEGRCVVTDYEIDKSLHQITVEVKAKPYKFKQNVTVRTVNLSGTSTSLKLYNGRKSVVPKITCTNDETEVKFNGGVYRLSAGTHKILDITFVYGNNDLTISGSGTITFEYQEGDL